MDAREIRRKFGDDYEASERTFKMGIDHRFTAHLAERFRGRRVLETCTGAGFTTMALARAAEHVVTIEIEPAHQAQARRNLENAGLLDRVTFVLGDALDPGLLRRIPPVDAAFLDPDWNDTGPGHVYRFKGSNTKPPADALLEAALRITENVALVLPPALDLAELEGLPPHERQELYLGRSHELHCLFFGSLGLASSAVTEFRVEG